MPPKPRSKHLPKAPLRFTDRAAVTRDLMVPLLHPGVRILDCGSRDGALLKYAAAATDAGRLVAIDIHNRVEAGVEYVAHDLEQRLPFGDDSFDIVICNDVLEHVEHKRQLMRELLRVTAQHAIISLPNTQYYKYVLNLMRGHMSKQYDFLVEDGVDRHRWVTYYWANESFIASQPGVAVIANVDVSPGPRTLVRALYAWLPRKFIVFNQVFLLRKT
jgi:SAM-dependent methyltransferase